MGTDLLRQVNVRLRAIKLQQHNARDVCLGMKMMITGFKVKGH